MNCRRRHIARDGWFSGSCGHWGRSSDCLYPAASSTWQVPDITTLVHHPVLHSVENHAALRQEPLAWCGTSALQMFIVFHKLGWIGHCLTRHECCYVVMQQKKSCSREKQDHFALVFVGTKTSGILGFCLVAFRCGRETSSDRFFFTPFRCFLTMLCWMPLTQPDQQMSLWWPFSWLCPFYLDVEPLLVFSKHEI